MSSTVRSIRRNVLGLSVLAAVTVWTGAAAADSFESGEICLGEQAVACITPIDPIAISRSSGIWGGSSVGIGVNHQARRSGNLLLGKATVGEQWSFKRGFGDPYVNVPLIFAANGWLAVASFVLGDQFQRLTTSQVRDLNAVGVSYVGGGLDIFTLPLKGESIEGKDLLEKNEARSSFLAVGLSARFHHIVLPDPIYLLPYTAFNDEVELRLVEQRPIAESDIDDLVFKLSPNLHTMLDLGPVVFETHAEFTYSKASDFHSATLSAAQEVRLAVVRALFEVGLAARGEQEFWANAPTFLLPSMGGRYAMRSATKGTIAAHQVGTLSLFAGPSFARVFGEVGWSRGRQGEHVSYWGGGLAIPLFRVMDLFDTRKLGEGPSVTVFRYFQAIDPEFVIGGNQEEGFVLTATVAGLAE